MNDMGIEYHFSLDLDMMGQLWVGCDEYEVRRKNTYCKSSLVNKVLLFIFDS